MASWLETAATHLGVPPLASTEIDALLDVARDVAHSTERRYAPLSAFLLGLHVGQAADRDAALSAAVAQLRDVLPEG